MNTFEKSRSQAKELILTFYPELHDLLKEEYNIEELMAELQSPQLMKLSMEDSRALKLRIWNDIKFQGILPRKPHRHTQHYKQL